MLFFMKTKQDLIFFMNKPQYMRTHSQQAHLPTFTMAILIYPLISYQVTQLNYLFFSKPQTILIQTCSMICSNPIQLSSQPQVQNLFYHYIIQTIKSKSSSLNQKATSKYVNYLTFVAEMLQEPISFWKAMTNTSWNATINSDIQLIYRNIPEKLLLDLQTNLL